MKFLFFLFLSAFFCSCKSEMSDEKFRIINKWIDARNFIIHSDFEGDSIHEAFAFRRDYLFLPEDTLNLKTKAHMIVYTSEWNKPYDIKKDYRLTLQKYLDYCKAHKVDPETYYKFLD